MLLGASWLCASKAAAAQSEGEEERQGERRRRRAAAAAGGEEMDESSLLDLLECSVCLERLDTTAKVLPCQHTFCRRCLESIVCSRHELRCPECRILVGCGVDELPANILLVRLLDGIRQRPRGSGGGGGSSSCSSNGNSPTARGHGPTPAGGGGGGGGNAPGSPAYHPAAAAAAATISGGTSAAASLRELAAASRSALLGKNISQLPCGKALYSYEGKEPGDLKFNKGDIIILRRKVDENWYHGELNGNHGFFPASYIQCIKPLPQAPPQGKALYDFEIKDKDQDKDCLTFTKLNESAKQLIEMDKTCLAAASGCDVSLPSDTNMAGNLAQCSTLSSSGAVSAIQRRIDGKKNAKKRHSFTALSMTHKSSQAMSNRHSMEISAPVLISSSDPRAATRIGELTHLSSSAPAQDSSSAGSATVAGPRTSAVVGEQGTSPKVQLPLNIYLALYAYKPQKNDELELRKGEMYRVIEKCQDGWFKGTSLRTGISGVFPGNYVTPVSRVPIGGAGQPRNNIPGGSPLAKGMAGAALPGGGSLTNPATTVRPIVPLTAPQTHPQHQAASPPLSNCLRHSAQQAASQSRSAMQIAAHPSAQSQDRPTATVSPLRTQSSPSRLPATGIRPHTIVSPQHLHQSSIQVVSGAQCPRPVIPLTSAASAITPPNVSAANLNGDMGSGPIGSLMTSSPTNTACKTEEKKNEKVISPLGKYRVVVSYPPQSEAEIELKEGDIVFVHKKREDGWYKGTLQRNGRTGLFPGSFVESF
ncbi:E3 ubiquitin-protein ligase SH3RF3-like [Vombatus ursinus]|uniref:E3 ubiquitin-protein ligase SH3RF3-like n=1 Tax=Vombatus ursinus TaxID=29139 RepID=UPI000FFD86A8|nr:E3 ubiquitin-protein ligase SH3RF3-like [Vombatus ursinus]